LVQVVQVAHLMLVIGELTGKVVLSVEPTSLQVIPLVVACLEVTLGTAVLMLAEPTLAAPTVQVGPVLEAHQDGAVVEGQEQVLQEKMLTTVATIAPVMVEQVEPPHSSTQRLQLDWFQFLLLFLAAAAAVLTLAALQELRHSAVVLEL
jgi:hypothetical protein